MTRAELRKFSDEDLLEELARRANQRGEKRVRLAKRWCHDCVNFRCWESSKAMPDNYNPCSKKHEMRFISPENGYAPGNDWGFYRLVCVDREALPPPPPGPDSDEFEQPPVPPGSAPKGV